eukprot:scaffold39694_cov19-Tisochrysis_lutea.AAC.1
MGLCLSTNVRRHCVTIKRMCRTSAGVKMGCTCAARLATACMLTRVLLQRACSLSDYDDAHVQDISWSEDGLYLCTVSDGAVYTWHMEGFRRCVWFSAYSTVLTLQYVESSSGECIASYVGGRPLEGTP